MRFGVGVDYVAAPPASVTGSVTASCTHHHCKHGCEATTTQTLEAESGQTLTQAVAEYELHTDLPLKPYVGAGVGVLERDWAASGTAGALVRVFKDAQVGVAYRVIGSGQQETNHGGLLVVKMGAW